MLMRERRCAPAAAGGRRLRAIAALGAGGSAWIWFAAFAANVAVRAVLALRFEAAEPELKVLSRLRSHILRRMRSISCFGHCCSA